MKCGDNCKTSPAHYSKLITIQKPKADATVDNSGHVDLTDDSNWETHTKAYAKVYTKGGREFYRAQHVDAELSHLWEVPSSTKIRSIDPTMRIQWDGRTFNIISTQDKDEERRVSEITTKEDV